MSPSTDATNALQAFLLDSIPLARAIDLRITDYSGQSLTMSAPLAPNVNDKGCAFGGSLASLMTLAGWALLELLLRQQGFDCDVYVGRSDIDYRTPVWKDFRAEARLHDDATRDAFVAALRVRGKARIAVRCRICADDTQATAATLDAWFVAKRREHQEPGR